MTVRPLAIDLFTGLHGWSEGLVAENYRVVGFDLHDMCAQFDQPRPENVQLVIQDVLTLHGSQFRSADLIVGSPPCQEFSYMAMPWTRAKAKAAAIRADETGAELERLNRLFNACFRIQREASEAAGRHIPMIVENVKGAQPWVGRSRWAYGSYHLWGDVPALMPAVSGRPVMKAGVTHRSNGATNFHGRKGVGPTGGAHGMKRWTNPAEGIKHHGSGAEWFDTGPAALSSRSPNRKFASAMIARIPLPLARHIAKVFYPC